MISKEQRDMIFRMFRIGYKKSDIGRIVNCSDTTVKTQIREYGMKRVLFLTDKHCGSQVGLTPPSYQTACIDNPETEEHFKRNKYSELQKECWNWYIRHLDLIGPVYKTFILGDSIDGDGKRSGGTEQITTDRKQQAAIAVECLSHVNTESFLFVYGTPYHTGQAEDFENEVARHYNAKIGSHEWEDVNGVVFDLKHKQSNCINPSTGLFNEVVANREWSVLDEQPKADVLVRAHTHRFCVLEMEDCLAISLPSLQAYGTKFGSRQCSRKVQFGMVALDVWPDGFVQRHVFIAKLAGHVTHVNRKEDR